MVYHEFNVINALYYFKPQLLSYASYFSKLNRDLQNTSPRRYPEINHQTLLRKINGFIIDIDTKFTNPTRQQHFLGVKNLATATNCRTEQ